MPTLEHTSSASP
jgi:hypothetical protein